MSTTERVVVVGAGMVGHRFVDELATRGDERFAITLVGDEAYEPYNRILLSDVLAGRTDVSALTLPMPPGPVRFHRGVAAFAIDRDNREVLLDDGTTIGYDRLVLATGARAFVPPIDGLEEKTPRHVHVLRTLDDCRDLTARAMNAKHAVVVGGGVLGLEAASGLRRRGVPVTVVDLDGHPMAAQLDPGPGMALREALGRSAIDFRARTSVAEVISAYGEIVAVRLTDDTVLAADLLLLSCGIRANTGLAEDAGLVVDRGIVVDEALCTTDPRIHAIGDCAQPASCMSGLLAPGWRQAERLVTSLVGEDRPSTVPDGSGVRLKADGIDLVTAGVRPSGAEPGDRVVTISDAAAGRHLDLVQREDRLLGFTVIGMPEVSAQVSLILDRGVPMPPDPLALLGSGANSQTQKASPLHMPGDTTVCRCNTVSKQDIVHAWEDGADSVDKIATATRATTGCGGCKEVVCGLVDWLEESDPSSPSQPVGERPAAAVARS